MGTEDPITTALSLSAGAEFHKCALQVNPFHYARTYRGQASTLDEASYVSALIDKAEALGISVLAVTDHNHVGGTGAIRAEAQGRGIHVFPGFELSSTEGIHVFCLYPPEATEAELERFLGEFGIRATEPSSSLCDKSFSELLARVRDQGGMSIAAHVTNDNGLLRVLHGQPRIQAWQDENLYAIQIPGSVQDLLVDIRSIVRNRNPDYARAYAPEADLAIAVVNAMDVASPDDLADPSATCWIKMSEISIEGLRQAFLDPGSRIRLHSEPLPEERSELVAMGWQGGFLDGAAIHFNSNLNVLVGGRGAGKSTVIESLRHVLGLDPLGEEAQTIHTGILRNVLRSGTKVSLLVRCHRPSPRSYRIERTIPNPPVVRDAHTGNVLNLTAADVFPGVEIYGQHEISELTKSPEKLTRLLGRFVEKDDSAIARKRELHRELERSRNRMLATRKELDDIDERLAALPGLEETLRRYQKAGLEEDLKEQSLLVREERVLSTIPERLKSFRSCLDELQQELPIDRTFLSPKALEDLPGKQILADADQILEQLNADLEKISQAFDMALATADQGIRGVHERFETRRATVQAAYEKKLRELQKSRIDGEEFIRLRRRIEELRPLKEQQSALSRIEAEHRESRRNLLVEWEEAKAEEFRAFERAGKRVTRKLKGRVRVRVEFGGNRESMFQLLRDEIGGRLSEAISVLRQVENLSLREFVQACRQGADSLGVDFYIAGTQAERLAKASDATLMQVEELDLPSTTKIELNTAPLHEPENWQALDQLSTGQKATAVLLLLLLESDAPLVVDQPEDDLDNRFITEGVVPRMREEKQRRQFLFSTHNANIPVLGDAELILGLSASGEADAGGATVAPEHMGSIDARPVRELVEELLEGGEDAFERRRRKYGF